MGSECMYDLITWLIGAGALTWLTFLAWYTVRAKWWKNPIGRNVFGTGGVILLILMRLFFARTFDGFRELDAVSLVVYTFVLAVGIQRIYQMESAQHVIDVATRSSGRLEPTKGVPND